MGFEVYENPEDAIRERLLQVVNKDTRMSDADQAMFGDNRAAAQKYLERKNPNIWDSIVREADPDTNAPGVAVEGKKTRIETIINTDPITGKRSVSIRQVQ